MDRHRLDLLRECNTKGAPLDAFEQGCCAHCINPECSRSQFGKSKFDARVGSWHDRLFSKVPRMNPQDPRFLAISGQKFHLIDVGRPSEVRTAAWMDPRDLSSESSVAPVSGDQGVSSEDVNLPAESKPTPNRPVSAQGVASRLLLANAPAQSGMISRPGAVIPTKEGPKKDPWMSPEPAENVVKPGATIKLRGSGV
jgi:hypothetical protein